MARALVIVYLSCMSLDLRGKRACALWPAATRKRDLSSERASTTVRRPVQRRASAGLLAPARPSSSDCARLSAACVSRICAWQR